MVNVNQSSDAMSPFVISNAAYRKTFRRLHTKGKYPFKTSSMAHAVWKLIGK